jgi:hypothetical protein
MLVQRLSHHLFLNAIVVVVPPLKRLDLQAWGSRIPFFPAALPSLPLCPPAFRVYRRRGGPDWHRIRFALFLLFLSLFFAAAVTAHRVAF